MINKIVKKFLITTLFLSFNQFPLSSYARPYDLKIDENKTNIDQSYLKTVPENFYILGPGDGLQVIVSKDYPELNTFTKVTGEGTINVPKLNKIYVEGLTVNELVNLMNEAYKEFVLYPSVEIQINKFRSLKVSVDGEITTPGLYNFKGIMESDKIPDLIQQPDAYFFAYPTLYDAIKIAGGITLNSDLSKIMITRKNSLSNGGGKIIAEINLEDAITSGDYSNNIRIYDGDQINIPKTETPNLNFYSKASKSNINPKFMNVLVSGRVSVPGIKRVTRLNTLNDAIDIAGGAKIIRGKVRYLSFEPDGTINKRVINYRNNSKRGSYSNPYLNEGDLIIVGNSLLGITNEVLGEITAPFQGVLTTFALIEALSD